MKEKLLIFATLVLLYGCGLGADEEDSLTLTSKFKFTWNIHETISRNSDGVIVYKAQPYGGLAASFKERNMPVDWSGYESIHFEFAQPTKVLTQIWVSDGLTVGGKPGITSLTAYFDGQNVKNIGEVALQAADTTTIYVKKIYLTPGGATWTPTTIWEGLCQFGNWENGVTIEPEKFYDALEGDKLEFVYETDQDDITLSYWQFKTIYNGTDKTLEGNDTELNSWGCALVGKQSTHYRIVLTANDATELKEHGLFVNGYHVNITQCNLLRKSYDVPKADQTTDNGL